MGKVTFDQFMDAARESLDDFERDYYDNHEKHPDKYPMEIDDYNEGFWWEQLNEHTPD